MEKTVLSAQNIVDYFEKKSKCLAERIEEYLLSKEHPYMFVTPDKLEELLKGAHMPVEAIEKGEKKLFQMEKVRLNILRDIVFDKIKRRGMVIERVDGQVYLDEESLEEVTTPMYWEISFRKESENDLDQDEQEVIKAELGDIDSIYTDIFSADELIGIKERIQRKEEDREAQAISESNIKEFVKLLRRKIRHVKDSNKVSMLNGTFIEFLQLTGFDQNKWHELDMEDYLARYEGIGVKTMSDSLGLHWVFNLYKK